jgi:hypothetical protein
MNESFRIHSLYFFLIVKDPTACSVKTDIKVLPLGYQFLVEVNGIEPMTSCLQSRRSPN